MAWLGTESVFQYKKKMYHVPVLCTYPVSCAVLVRFRPISLTISIVLQK